MSQIYNLTSGVTVTSFPMGSTVTLNIIAARNLEKCVQSFAFLSCCDVIDPDVKGGNCMPPPPSGRRVAWRPGGRRVNGMQLFSYFL